MKITYLGHAACRLDIPQASILIDPFLSETRPFPNP